MYLLPQISNFVHVWLEYLKLITSNFEIYSMLLSIFTLGNTILKTNFILEIWKPGGKVCFLFWKILNLI